MGPSLGRTGGGGASGLAVWAAAANVHKEATTNAKNDFLIVSDIKKRSKEITFKRIVLLQKRKKRKAIA
jgi:hypothetical protein